MTPQTRKAWNMRLLNTRRRLQVFELQRLKNRQNTDLSTSSADKPYKLVVALDRGIREGAAPSRSTK